MSLSRPGSVQSEQIERPGQDSAEKELLGTLQNTGGENAAFGGSAQTAKGSNC